MLLIIAEVPYVVTHKHLLGFTCYHPRYVSPVCPTASFLHWQHLRFPQSQLSPLRTVTTAMLSLWVTDNRGCRGTAGDKDKSICAVIFFTWSRGIGTEVLASRAGSSEAIQGNGTMALTKLQINCDTSIKRERGEEHRSVWEKPRGERRGTEVRIGGHKRDSKEIVWPIEQG